MKSISLGGDVMNYKNIAEKILQHLGGQENIISAAHCATRLRLVLNDETKANKKEIEDIEGVKGAFSSSGQFQIILGTGTVNKVYAELSGLANVEGASKEELKQIAAKRMNIFQRAIRVLSDIFVAIIPAIVASGLMMGLMESLSYAAANGYIPIDPSGSLFTLLKMFSNAAYIFLPILIGFSAARVFGGNAFLGAAVAMIMIHPDLQNAWTISEGIKKTLPVWFGLYNIPLVGYQGHVLPIVLSVGFMSIIEKRVRKIVPEVIDLFVTPLVTLLVTGYISLTIIGPVFVYIENFVLNGVQTLLAIPLGIGGAAIGAIYSTTVITGLHHSYVLIDLGQLSKLGYTYWLPIASAANVAQGGAALAVALRTKNKKVKGVAVPSALSACLGITEPAIFGVNLRFMRPFIGGVIGAVVAGFYVSLIHLGAKGLGVTGLFGILLHLHAPLQYIISILIAFGVAFGATLLLGWKEETE